MKLPRPPRQPLPGLLVSAGAGIVAAEYFAQSPAAIPAALALFALAAALVIFRGATVAVWVCAGCAFFLLHWVAIEDDPGRDLARMFAEKPLVKATGIVASAPQERESAKGAKSAEFQLRLESLVIGNASVRTSVVVQARWVGDGPAYGDRVAITGEASNIAPPRNPGQFDYAAYMRRLGIYSEISMLDATSGEVLDGGHGNPLVALALKTRHWVQQKLQVDLDDSPDVSGLVQGLTLGLKRETPEETREMFQLTGTLHLFVVNGLHIGMFSYLMFLLVRLCGAGRALSVLIVAPLICFYALLTGSSTGSIRAAVMAAIFLAGMLADGKPLMLNNLAAAGLLILAWNTNELFMPGFQFSFGVVLAIILLADGLQNFLGKFGKPDPFIPRKLWSKPQKFSNFCSHHVAKFLGVSIAASIGSLPFAAQYFHLLTLSSVPANLFVVPLAFFILAEALLSGFGGIFSNSLSALFNNVNYLLVHGVLAVVHFFAQVPFGHFYVEMPPFQAKPTCEITVLDVGDGGAIHVRAGGKDWLADCGNASPYEAIVRNYLHSRGISRLDGFVVSHGNSKFIGAASEVEQDFAPAESIDSPLDDRSPMRRKYHEWLAAHARPRTTLTRGDVIDISPSVKVRVLYPPPDSDARLADDKTLVLRLECAGSRVLFLCGAGNVAEQWLLDNEPDLRCDVLVKSPHSNENPALLDAIRPSAVICSSSGITAAGRIDDAWAGEVAAHGIRLFRQDETGAVTVKLDSGKLAVKAFMDSQAFAK